MNYGTAIPSPKRLRATVSPISRSRKQSMKKTFKQRIREWLNNDNHEESYIVEDEHSINLQRESSIRFEIHQAAGGRIVQTRRYDERKDRNIENLYIITPDQDFGRELDKIITMEALRG